MRSFSWWAAIFRLLYLRHTLLIIGLLAFRCSLSIEINTEMALAAKLNGLCVWRLGAVTAATISGPEVYSAFYSFDFESFLNVHFGERARISRIIW